jgi:hypothetical protein
MVLLNGLVRILPTPDFWLMCGLFSDVSVIFLRLPLSSDLNLITTLTLERRLCLKLQLSTTLPNKVVVMSTVYSTNTTLQDFDEVRKTAQQRVMAMHMLFDSSMDLINRMYTNMGVAERLADGGNRLMAYMLFLRVLREIECEMSTV